MIRNLLDLALRFLSRDVWLLDGHTMARSQQRLLALGQTLVLAGFRLHRARGALHARALTSITMLSLVPLLAFVFVVAKSFGVYHRLQTHVIHPTLDRWLNGAEAPELRSAVDQIFQFVQDTNLQSLGLLGLLVTAFAAIRMLTAVEHALNDLWDVRRPRNLLQKLIQYVAVLIVVPGFVLIATTATTALRNHTLVEMLLSDSTLGPFTIRGLSFLTVWGAFAFLYSSLPNVKVSRGAALLGGLTGGTLWMITHYAHLQLQVGVAETNALYASFSAFPVFLLWVFASWIMVLAGGSVAAAHELREAHRDRVIQKHLGTTEREIHAVAMSMLLSHRFKDPTPPTLVTACLELGISVAAGDAAISSLVTAGLAHRDDQNRLGLAVGPDDVRLTQILQVCRHEGAPIRTRDKNPWVQRATAAIQHLQTSAQHHPANATLSTLNDDDTEGV